MLSHLSGRVVAPTLLLSAIAVAPAPSTAAPEPGFFAIAPASTAAAPAKPVFFVDPVSGDDTATGLSPDTAWASLDRASREPLRPGSSLLLARGTAFDGVLTVSASGTKRAPIRVGAFTPDRSSATGPAQTCVEVSGSWVEVSDVDASDCGRAGFDVTGDDVTLRGVSASGNVAGVWIRPGADRASVIGSSFADNDLMAPGTPGSDDDYGAFGVEINGDDAKVIANTFTGHRALSPDYGYDGSAVEIYKASGAVVARNRSVDNLTFVEFGGVGSADSVIAFNEVRSTVADSSFLMTRGPAQNFGPVIGTRAVHNSVHLDAPGAFGFGCYGGCDSSILSLSRNLFVVEGRGSYVGYADGTFDSTHNHYVGELYFPLGRTDSGADPMWQDARAGDFRLRPGSPAIDRVRPLRRWRYEPTGVPSRMGRTTARTADLGAVER